MMVLEGNFIKLPTILPFTFSLWFSLSSVILVNGS